MINKNLQIAAEFMGYRLAESLKYLKPIGFACLSIDIETSEIVSWFKHAFEDKSLSWDSEVLNKCDEENTIEDLIARIKWFETYSIHLSTTESEYQFLTLEQSLNEIS